MNRTGTNHVDNIWFRHVDPPHIQGMLEQAVKSSEFEKSVRMNALRKLDKNLHDRYHHGREMCLTSQVLGS